ncbi:MAG TPA: hypothetical protein VFB45_03500 [Pseudolabrys sp.]|nr:hypothetical protein [Pseudolabrys sp.]
MSGMIAAAALTTAAIPPAHAEITAELANKCRALMVKAHPTLMYGSTGSAGAQRTYFKDCLAHNGDMPEPAAQQSGSDPSATGTIPKARRASPPRSQPK